jgi:formate C-acetyltransferase
MGFSNIADSLFSLKKCVFDEAKFSISEVCDWLSDDWTDAEDKREFFYNRIDKYGNDKDGVDAMAATVVNHFCDVLEPYRNFRGGAFWPGIFSVGFHITMGAFTGASADGRFSGDTLGNGITPSNGVTLQGPTAIMNSVNKLPLERVFNGANLNMRFHGKKTETKNLLPLIQTYFEKGGEQVQFNMVDSETLKAARQNPNHYRDLVVRISGYSGRFINLSDIAQEEIISRSECKV